MPLQLHLLLLWASFSVVLSQINPGFYSNLLGPIDDYDRCKYLGSPTVNGPNIFWSISEPNIEMAITAQTNGFVGIGWNRITPRMEGSDAVIGYATEDPEGFVEDYYLQTKNPCSGKTGSCPDTIFDGQKDVSGNATRNGGVTTVRFTRLLDTGDSGNLDLKITNKVIAHIWAVDETIRLVGHSRSGTFSMNPFEDQSCPKGVNDEECSGALRGNCVKGCCVCEPGAVGYDCATDSDHIPTEETTEPFDPTPTATQDSPLDPEINPDDYQFQQELDPSFKIFWSIFQDEGEIEIAIQAKGSGWASFGLTRSGQMIDADVTLGWITDAGIPFVGDYNIGSERGSLCPDGVCMDTEVGGEDDVISYNGAYVDGATQLKWRRKLNTGDSKDIPITEGSLDCIWGFQPDYDGPSLAPHPTTTSGIVQIDFLTGSIQIVDRAFLIFVHGISMFIAWGILIPIGSAIARYVHKESYPGWFNIHRLVQSTAVFVTVFAFIFGIEYSTEHFNSIHKVLGLIIVSLALLQPVLGQVADKWFFIDRKSTPVFPDYIHWILGYLSFVAALINMALGLWDYEVKTGLLGAYVVFAFLLLFVIIGMAIYKMACRDPKKE